jgi:large subunit ribosomal protein L9
MGTEVLLMADVENVGSEGDVVTVADGFARNYLFPRKLAAPVTGATRRRLEKIRRDRESARQAALGAAKDLAARLAAVSCTVPVKVGKEDKLYGSVTAGDVAGKLAAQGFAVDRQQVALDEPIRELGAFNVKIRLHPEVEASVKVWVVEE